MLSLDEASPHANPIIEPYIIKREAARMGTFFENIKLLPLINKYNLPGTTQAAIEKGLRKAANNGNVEDLRFFLKYVDNVNAVDSNPSSRKTALHWATLKGHKVCCE